MCYEARWPVCAWSGVIPAVPLGQWRVLKLDARRVLTSHIVFWDYIHSKTETDVLDIWNIWHTLLTTIAYDAFFAFGEFRRTLN
jgi:hypothetical protein